MNRIVLRSCITFTLAGFFACGAPEPHWHVRGPLWAAALERNLEAEGNQLHKRRGEAGLWELPLAPTRVLPLKRASAAKGSISVGSVVDGFLINGKRLPLEGLFHRATTDQKTRGTWEGSDEMVALLLHSAEAYAKIRPGSKLSIANIGRRGGGRILWSVSHRNGRDADILFPVLDDKGQPLQLDKMVHLDAKGIGTSDGGQAVHLDIDGMVAVVLGLVDQDLTQIQHLFISNPLRKMVLKRAEEQGIPRSMLRKIKAVLRQPRGALPHDDHLHIRIACSADDVLDGCRHLNHGAFKKTRNKRTRKLVKQGTSQNQKLRVESIEMLGRLASMDKQVARVLKKALGASLELRIAAVSALRGQGGRTVDQLVARTLTRGAPASLAAEALRTIEARVDKPWSQSLTILLDDSRSISNGEWPGFAQRTVREEAIWLSGLTGDSNLVPRILPFVDHPRLGQLANQALERITLIKPGVQKPTTASWRSALPRKESHLREKIRERMRAFKVLRRNGRPYHRGCYKILDDPWHALRQLGRRLLDQSHSRAIHQPRWSATDLRWYWRRKLRIR